MRGSRERRASGVLPAVVLVALVASATLVACDDDDEGAGPAVSPTTSGTPTFGTPLPDTTPTGTAAASPAATATAAASPELEAFRSFAAEIDAALAARDRSFFEQRAAADTLGLSVWRSDDGRDAPAAEVISLLETLWATEVEGAGDGFGDAGVQVFAIGDTNIPGPTVAAVLAAIIERPPGTGGEGPLRAVLVSHWVDEGGAWRLTGVMDAFVLGEDFLTEDGVGRGYLRTWERFER